MNNSRHKLKTILTECEQHRLRLAFSHGQIKDRLPFSISTINALKDEEVSYVDQYIFRFSKLQDAIGQKLVTALLATLGEEVHQKSFIDKFNRLEQLGVLTDYERWQELRIIRNEVAHEYGKDEKELTEKLNLLFAKKKELLDYLECILNYVRQKDLLA